MTTNLTATISGISYPVLNTTYTLDDKVDERSTATLSIFDANGTYSFQFGQPITISDTLEGIKFTGFVAKPTAVKYDANAALHWTLNCVDNEFLAGKKTSNRIITNQYAGIAAVSMINDYLSQDGVVANYAIRDDNTQNEFAQGTLSNTVATSNLGGDLELALAGSTVTIIENTTSVFASGTLSHVTASNNTIAPTTTSAIKMVCTQNVPNGGNSYTYIKIFKPSGSFSIGSSDSLSYYVWIDSSSPECKFGVDIIFTDGTNVRDHSNSNDVQNIPPHPASDLSGVAKDQWYYRQFFLGNFSGKNVAYIVIACEGDTPGTYTAYFKNINCGSQTIFASSFNVNPPQQMQTNGYSNTKLSIVNTVDTFTNVSFRTSPSYSIDAVKIIKNSFITWQSILPPNTYLIVQYSIDGGNSFITCTNNSPLPNLPAGISVSGENITFYIEFHQSPGSNPEQPNPAIGTTPAQYFSLYSLECILQSSFASSKTDVLFSTVSGWTGTLNNTVDNGALNLIGAVRNYDDGNSGSQSLFGGSATPSGVSQGCNLRAFSMTINNNNDQAVSRMDFAGTFSAGTIEVDVYVDNANAKIGVTYFTTNWSNYDANYAYAIEITTTSITLQRGSNSSASSTGSRTQLATASLTLSSGTWHHLKVVFAAGSHTIYFDDIQELTSSDSTYTSAANIGCRISNGTGGTYSARFDNFGVVKALSGTYVSANTSISSATTYGNSIILWQDVSTNQNLVALLVEASLNGGSSYTACTNGSPIPGLTVGQSLSGVSVQFRVTLTASTASAMPGINDFNVYVLGQFSSTGTRIAPFLSLSNVGIAGSTLAAWTATTPTNTSVTLATSLDGSTYTNVSNGGQIAGITSQPSATLDSFDRNSSPNYTSTFGNGGSAAPFFWDTLNSRITVTGGSLALLLYNSINISNVDMVVDMDHADVGGIVFRCSNTSNYYELVANDGSSSNTPNQLVLGRMAGGTRTFPTQGTISFTRGSKYRIRVTMVGGLITAYFDGVQIFTYTDGSPLAAGQCGLVSDTGTSQFYNLRIQPQGDSLIGKIVYSKVTLNSTDPTATPQLTDLTVAALNPKIGIGSLVPTADYTNTYISDNINDLAKKSDYAWWIDQNLNFIFGPRVAQPAPWVLQSADQYLLINGSLTVDYSADLYRNEMVLDNVIATNTNSETKIGDGTTTSWVLGGNLVSPPPLVYVNNQFQTIGIKGLTTGKNFYWTPGSPAIDQDASGTVLQQTDTISFQNYTYQYSTSITVDNINLANTVTQKQFAQIMGRYAGTQTVLNLASAAQTTSSDAGDLDVSKYRRIAVDINITVVSGTSPTIQFFVDRKDANGLYYNIWTDSSVNATGQRSVTIGPLAAIQQSLGSTVKLRWTITGTSPSLTFSASVIGSFDVQSAGLGIVAVKEDVSSQALNVAAATAYGNTLLSRYGSQGRTITFKTWRTNPSLAVGQYLPVFLPQHGINDASMLITQISTTQDIGYQGGSPTQIYYQTITCTEQASIGSAWKLLASAFR